MFLIERTKEKKFFEKSLKDSERGRGSVLLVTGADGCGKTELLHQFADHARSEQLVTLMATCFQSEREFPLSVMEQLLTQSELPLPLTDEANTLLESGKDIIEANFLALSARFSEGFHKLFTRLSKYYPLMLCIDDVHNIDRVSLQCLLYLIRRIRAERMVIILTEREDMTPGHSLILGDLLRQPHVGQFRLAPLGRGGTDRLLAHHLGATPPKELAADFFQLTGGNPMLLHTLIQDLQKRQPIGGAPLDGAVVPGMAYHQAVVALLRRHEPHVLQMAQGLALFSGASPNRLLEQLFDAGPGAADHALRILTHIGLVEDGDFRHPQICAALLADLSPEERAVLHQRAAELLYEQGAPPVEVAHHLIAGGHTETPWSVPLLEEAVDQALAENDSAFARQALEYAAKMFTDKGLNSAIRAKLLEHTWGASPEATVRHLAPLVADLRAGHLPARYAFSLARTLVWYAQGAKADDVLDALDSRETTPDRQAASEAEVIRAWLSVIQPSSVLPRTTQPGTAPAGSPPPAEPRAGMGAPQAGDVRLRAFALLKSALRDGVEPTALTEAEQILRYTEFNTQTFEAVFSMITLLIHSEQIHKAITWCDKLEREVVTAQRPELRAQILALRAQALLRQSDLLAAYHNAHQSISLLPPPAWGVAVGFPLSILVEACTEMRREEEVLTYIDHPVPQEMYNTRYGLPFLYARGLYNLACDQVEAASADFGTCGGLMELWELDSPTFIPWRIGAAEARRRSGDHDAARGLISDQLARLSRDQPRMWGVSLSAMAELTEPAERHAVLTEATDMLDRSGDHLELARALTKLGHTYEQLGEDGSAATMFQRAQQAVKEYDSDPLTGTWPPQEQAMASYDASGVDDPVLPALSYAEQRVAVLAAQGYTNRQISARLHITVSTVEQHLTRIYRKLGVKDRKNLADLVRSQS
ncbi:AAA family ATPase [Nonomuraea sp. NPDC050643]|uniref:helix-turn-helix transcriptional regulator n=1 Tax=Nonomuraea sp. NPDC050643 TaxID=3155660 RepID=UPI0033DB372D